MSYLNAAPQPPPPSAFGSSDDNRASGNPQEAANAARWWQQEQPPPPPPPLPHQLDQQPQYGGGWGQQQQQQQPVTGVPMSMPPAPPPLFTSYPDHQADTRDQEMIRSPVPVPTNNNNNNNNWGDVANSREEWTVWLQTSIWFLILDIVALPLIAMGAYALATMPSQFTGPVLGPLGDHSKHLGVGLGCMIPGAIIKLVILVLGGMKYIRIKKMPDRFELLVVSIWLPIIAQFRQESDSLDVTYDIVHWITTSTDKHGNVHHHHHVGLNFDGTTIEGFDEEDVGELTEAMGRPPGGGAGNANELCCWCTC